MEIESCGWILTGLCGLAVRDLETYWIYLKYKTHVRRGNVTERQMRDTERLAWNDVGLLLRDLSSECCIESALLVGSKQQLQADQDLG